MSNAVFVFECNSQTYTDCMQKGVFASNLPWPLKVQAEDWCLLYHYEVSTLFGVWKAECDGGRKLIPGLWKGRFPFQARVRQVSREITEIPKEMVSRLIESSPEGRIGHVIDGTKAKELMEFIGRTG